MLFSKPTDDEYREQKLREKAVQQLKAGYQNTSISPPTRPAANSPYKAPSNEALEKVLTVKDYGITNYKPQAQQVNMNVDYSKAMSDAMLSPGNSGLVQQLLDARGQKIKNDPALAKYEYDNAYLAAQQYLKNEPKREETDKLANTIRNSILNRDDFKYDYEKDPTYQQYAKTYQREGQRAMQDTIGTVAAQTGGLASSYATSAGNQAYNNYAAKTADVIPQLEQLAYQRYQNELAEQRGDYNMLHGESREAVGDFNTDTDRRINKGYQDAQFGLQKDDFALQKDKFDYGKTIDERNFAADDRNFAAQQETAKYDRARDLLSMGISNGQIATDLGVSIDEANKIVNDIATERQLGFDATRANIANTQKSTSLMGASRSSGGGSSGSSRSSSGSTAITSPQDIKWQPGDKWTDTMDNTRAVIEARLKNAGGDKNDPTTAINQTDVAEQVLTNLYNSGSLTLEQAMAIGAMYGVQFGVKEEKTREDMPWHAFDGFKF